MTKEPVGGICSIGEVWVARPRIAHIVNPVRVPLTSHLSIAQPVTFESLRVAAAAAACEVTVLWTGYDEDVDVAPDWMVATPRLTRSAADLRSFEEPRKLPILRDILDRLVQAGQYDLGIYSNVDIAVMPFFYEAIAALHASGVDAMVINRRTIPAGRTDPGDLALMYPVIGAPHPGRDCFVFRPDRIADFDLGSVIVGIGDFDRVMTWNVAVTADTFRWLKHSHLTFHLGNDRDWDRRSLIDYHEHNNLEANAVFHRLEQKHGPLRDRAPFDELLPRPLGYWPERWRHIEEGSGFFARMRQPFGRIKRRVARRAADWLNRVAQPRPGTQEPEVPRAEF